MDLTRRECLRVAAAGLAGAALPFGALAGHEPRLAPRFKVGVTDWNLQQTGKIEAIALAKAIGFDGVQVSFTRTHPFPLADPAVRAKFLAESTRVGLPLASTCLDILHVNYLKNDPLGQRWVAEAIPLAKDLGVRVILLPFFGNGALKTEAEMDYVGDALREIAPAAEKAGVILGLEDTISARDNVRIMERTKSPAVLTYYDVGNSTNNGFNVIEEIRWLGKERICEVHLKDNPHYMGEGKIDFPGVVAALDDIGFAGWAQLETTNPTKSVQADMGRNLSFVRDLIARRAANAR
jgi:sugar phosphate isomerase/epimerase